MFRQLMAKRVLLIVLLLVSVGAVASTVVEVDQTCPLCDHQFKAMMAASGSQFDMRLDLKPVGAILAPWPVAVCPKCGFVLFSDDISDEDKSILREYVAKDEYKQLGTRADYYRMARLLEKLGRPPTILAHIYLQASWQEEESEAWYKEDAEACIKYVDLVLADLKDHGEEWQTMQLIKGELLRRLSRFDEALVLFQALQPMPEFKGNILSDIVGFQITLCNNKDKLPHNVSEAKTVQ